MRYLCVPIFLLIAPFGLAQESGQIVVGEVPPEAAISVAVGSTCCGNEHLDNGDRYYTKPEHYRFDTRKDKELIEFNFLLTDSIAAPAPQPRQEVSEWDK